jgi:hypothetical protein
MAIYPFEPGQPGLRATITAAGVLVDLTTLGSSTGGSYQLRVYVRGAGDVFGAWAPATGSAPVATAAAGYAFPARSDQVITVSPGTTRLHLIAPDADTDVHITRGTGQ